MFWACSVEEEGGGERRKIGKVEGGKKGGRGGGRDREGMERREKWERVGEKEGGREEREGEIGRLEIYREGRGGDRVEERERA